MTAIYIRHIPVYPAYLFDQKLSLLSYFQTVYPGQNVEKPRGQAEKTFLKYFTDIQFFQAAPRLFNSQSDFLIPLGHPGTFEILKSLKQKHKGPSDSPQGRAWRNCLVVNPKSVQQNPRLPLRAKKACLYYYMSDCIPIYGSFYFQHGFLLFFLHNSHGTKEIPDCGNLVRQD